MKNLTLLLTVLATLLLMPALTACGNDDEPEMPGFPAGPFNGTIYIQETQDGWLKVEITKVPNENYSYLTYPFAHLRIRKSDISSLDVGTQEKIDVSFYIQHHLYPIIIGTKMTHIILTSVSRSYIPFPNLCLTKVLALR